MAGDDGTWGETVNVVDIARALARDWRVLLLSTLVGVAGAVAVLRFAAPIWTASASVLVRDASPLPSALMQQVGGSGLAGAATALLGGALKSSVETDLALVKSRELVGEVIDSLGLRVVVTSPHGTPPRSVVQATKLVGAFRPFKLRLEEAPASGVHVKGRITGTKRKIDTVVAPGTALVVPAGTIRIAAVPLLPATIRIVDREDAITRSVKRLDAERTGGEVLGISWPAEDSLSAPDAANLLIERFLIRRRGVDRGINQRRLEFVSRQIDSIDRALNDALRRQREFHQRAETVDPAVSAKTFLEALLKAREQRAVLVMDEQALKSLQAQLRTRTVQPRQLAAYPEFLRSLAINELLGRIVALEAEHVALLQQMRREDDPKVAAVRVSIASLESQLEPLARTYGEAIAEQRATLDTEIASLSARLAQLPQQVEVAFQLVSEVERLSRTSLALNAQRVELRLATIGEGGEARTVDVAYARWKRSFPSTILTLIVGTAAGFALGFALSLARAQGGAGAVEPSAPPH